VLFIVAHGAVGFTSNTENHRRLKIFTPVVVNTCWCAVESLPGFLFAARMSGDWFLKTFHEKTGTERKYVLWTCFESTETQWRLSEVEESHV
jgi:hypothetical protein